MKSNYQAVIKNRVANDISITSSTIKRLWEMCTLIVLHRYFHLNEEGLREFADDMKELYSDFMRLASASDPYDKKHRELTNIDYAIISAIRELRRDGIDHRDILGDDEQLIIIDEDGKRTNLDDFVDILERRDNRESD